MCCIFFTYLITKDIKQFCCRYPDWYFLPKISCKVQLCLWYPQLSTIIKEEIPTKEVQQLKNPNLVGNTVTKLDHYNLKWPVRANFLNKRIWTKYSSHWKLISMQYIEIKIKVMESMSEFIDTWMYRNKTFFSIPSPSQLPFWFCPPPPLFTEELGRAGKLYLD